MDANHPPHPDPSNPENPTRRGFFTGAIYAIWTAIGAALGIPALIYLLFPPKLHHEAEWVEAGDAASLKPNEPVEMVYRSNRVDGWKVTSEKNTAWVVLQPDQTVVAFGPQCTHLGCAYHWEKASGKFVCPCHTSLFSLDGKVTAGPAPRALDRFDARVQDGKVLLGRLRQSSGGAA